MYRSWAQSIFLTIIMGVWLLVSISSFTNGDIVAERDWLSLIFYPITGVLSILGIRLAIRSGVVIDDEGIHLRTFGRGRHLLWDAIDTIEFGAYDQRLMFTLYAPIVVLVPEKSRQRSLFGVPMSPKPVAELIPLTSLGSYVQATAQRRTDQLCTDLSTLRHAAHAQVSTA
jgi:hypothetical protein